MVIGFLGLGKMGSRMARKVALAGHSVHVWNRTSDTAKALATESPSILAHDTTASLIAALKTPKIIWMMLPAGQATETVYQEALSSLVPGDILIDGGNANYKDTDKRYAEASSKGVRFLGIGVSGGVVAERQGYCFMVGGDQSAYEEIKPILSVLSEPSGGHEYFGVGGSGHFVKMVHNGIEYGIMQSLGEGFDVLTQSPYALDIQKAAAVWQRGSLVSGYMLDRTVEALKNNPTLDGLVGSIGATGEASWMVTYAREKGIPVELIEASLAYRTRSQSDNAIQTSFTARLIAALRNAFGGHEVVKK